MVAHHEKIGGFIDPHTTLIANFEMHGAAKKLQHWGHTCRVLADVGAARLTTAPSAQLPKLHSSKEGGEDV